jgi:hypothetical protein
MEKLSIGLRLAIPQFTIHHPAVYDSLFRSSQILSPQFSASFS